MKRIAFRLFVIATVGVLAIKASNAFFSDRETSAENHFTAGKLDLKVNDQDNPPSIVTLSSMEAGDDRIASKTLFVDNNPAKVFLHLKDLVPSQGEETEPETEEELVIGPKDDIQNYMTYDLTVGDLTIITSGSLTPLTDAVSCWIPLGTIPGSTSVPMLQSFHFDQGVTDWAQGDTLSFTEEFLAQQVNDPTVPDTESGRSWNTSINRCISGQGSAPLYNSNPYTCVNGAGDTSGPQFGTVHLFDTGTAIIAQATLIGATPNATYDIWLNEDPGGCPLGTPTAPGAILTDGSGNGTGSASKTKTSGATRFWISGVGGGQVLRSVVVTLP